MVTIDLRAGGLTVDRVSGLTTSTFKRALLGRAFATEDLSRERLPKRLALPTFASDALSAVAYAPDEILLTLAIAGITAYAVSPWVALAVVALMAVVVTANRHNVEEYPDGGGDYRVVQDNLGQRAGRAVGAALLVDYVLTVAVSISQAAAYASGGLPFLHGWEPWIAIGLIVLVTLVNLRGVRESGRALAVPVYLFMGSLGLLLLVGGVQALTGGIGAAPSAGLEIVPDAAFDQGLTALGGAFLVLRAFSSGCAALTGVEAVGNGVPSFRPPKSRNAATTLVILGAISSVFILGIILLAGATGVRYVADPATQLTRDGAPVGDYQQIPVIAQIAQAVFAPASPLFYLVLISTGVVLFLAANTAFNGFPNLASSLARSRHLPRQLRLRGDRLAYSNGILMLSLASIVLVWLTGADVSLLIQMYIVGVFVSFSLAQLGMTIHFTRQLRVTTDGAQRRRIVRRRVVNAFAFGVVTVVLVIVLMTRFLQGAWIAVLAMVVLWLLMTGVSRHYRRVRTELALPADQPDPLSRPTRSHALVLVASLDRPTMRALAVASATRPTTIEAIIVDDEDVDWRAVADRWRDLDVQIPLRILYAPYRQFSAPVLAHVMNLLSRSPRDEVVVYIPEFLVGHWWEALLHNHSARRLRARLEHLPRVVVASVPWQLGSAQDAVEQVQDEVRSAALRGRGRAR